MTSRRQFSGGLIAVGLVTAAVAFVEFRESIRVLFGVGVAAGLLLAAVGLASALGYGFDADGDNKIAGVLAVFAAVAAFGLVVAGLIHAIE